MQNWTIFCILNYYTWSDVFIVPGVRDLIYKFKENHNLLLFCNIPRDPKTSACFDGRIWKFA